MTDETDTPETPEADEVRRLLGAARHTEPMPADVVARMDAVLAGLGQGTEPGRHLHPGLGPGPSEEPDANVASLAAQRRRRAASLLVAAAAIVVGGVAVAQHLPSGGTSAATTADAHRDASAFSGNTSGQDQSLSARPEGAPNTTPQATVRHGRVVVRRSHFGVDALAARRLLASAHKGVRAAQTDAARSGCVAAPPDTYVLKATYRRADAALVYHRQAGSSQVVDLFVCGSTRPIRSVTLSTP